MVILAVHNALKGFDGVGQFDVFAGVPRKLFRHGERLREELLDSAGTGHGFLSSSANSSIPKIAIISCKSLYFCNTWRTRWETL